MVCFAKRGAAVPFEPSAKTMRNMEIDSAFERFNLLSTQNDLFLGNKHLDP